LTRSSYLYLWSLKLQILNFKGQLVTHNQAAFYSELRLLAARFAHLHLPSLPPALA